MWRTMLRVLPSTFKPLLKQIRLLQVIITRILTLNSDWLILRGRHAIYGRYVTCCKTSLHLRRATCADFVAKPLSTFCNIFFATSNNLIFYQIGFWFVSGKMHNIASSSFCSNVTKQVARFDFVAYFTVLYCKSLEICSLWSEDGFWEAVVGCTLFTVEAFFKKDYQILDKYNSKY